MGLSTAAMRLRCESLCFLLYPPGSGWLPQREEEVIELTSCSLCVWCPKWIKAGARGGGVRSRYDSNQARRHSRHRFQTLRPPSPTVGWCRGTERVRLIFLCLRRRVGTAICVQEWRGGGKKGTSSIVGCIVITGRVHERCSSFVTVWCVCQGLWGNSRVRGYQTGTATQMISVPDCRALLSTRLNNDGLGLVRGSPAVNGFPYNPYGHGHETSHPVCLFSTA